MAPALVPLFTNEDPSSMIFFCFAQNHSRPQNAVAIPSDSVSAVFTKTAAGTDTADRTLRDSRARESATGFATEIEPSILWVDMGFDMGYV